MAAMAIDASVYFSTSCATGAHQSREEAYGTSIIQTSCPHRTDGPRRSPTPSADGVSRCSPSVTATSSLGARREIRDRPPDAPGRRLRPQHRAHREDADRHRDGGVLAELHADLTLADEIGDHPSLAFRKTDEDAPAVAVDDRHLVGRALKGEAPPELVHRDVGARLDETPQLRLRAVAAGAGGFVARPWRGRRDGRFGYVGHGTGACRFVGFGADRKDGPVADDSTGVGRTGLGHRDQPSTTRSSRPPPLRTSAPSGVQTTMSSMRAPYRPSR